MTEAAACLQVRRKSISLGIQQNLLSVEIDSGWSARRIARPNHLRLRHACKRKRARCYCTYRLVGVRFNSLHTSAEDSSCHSRIKNSRPCAGGKRPTQASSTAKNCYGSRLSCGLPHSHGASEKWPSVLKLILSSLSPSLASSSPTQDTSRICLRKISISLCFKIPTSQVLSCERLPKLCGLDSAAQLQARKPERVHAGLYQLVIKTDHPARSKSFSSKKWPQLKTK